MKGISDEQKENFKMLIGLIDKEQKRVALSERMLELEREIFRSRAEAYEEFYDIETGLPKGYLGFAGRIFKPDDFKALNDALVKIQQIIPGVSISFMDLADTWRESSMEAQEFSDWIVRITGEIKKLENQIKSYTHYDVWAGYEPDIDPETGLPKGWMIHPEKGIPIAIDKYVAEMEKAQQPILDFINSIESTWTNAFTNMLTGTESFMEVIKASFKSLADAFIQQIMRMMVQWAIFGSIMGAAGFETGQTFGGILGLLGIKKWQHGGIVTKPTLGIVGEAGPEAIIPLGSHKISSPSVTGGDNAPTFIYISAMDAKSFSEFIRRNPGPIINTIGRDNRKRGTLRR